MPIQFLDVVEDGTSPEAIAASEYGPLPLRLAAVLISVLVLAYAVMRIPRS